MSFAALVGCCCVSFVSFGLPLLAPGRQYVGPYDDPQIPIWSFGWWPHAILGGENPFVTHAVWFPTGVNLTWTNAVPALSLLFSPLTWLVGPVASYNVAALLMPALAAWAAFLLCRRLTRSTWPSLFGGYLFGFSSYELAQQAGHLQLITVFVLPLVALIALRYLDNELSGRQLVLRLGPLLAFQFLTSTELSFTLALALAGSILLGLAVAPAGRARLRSLLLPVLGAYAFAALLTAPYVYYALKGFLLAGFIPPTTFHIDLLNLVIPTHLVAAGSGWAQSIANHFPPGDNVERVAYLGVPVLMIVCLFARRRWRTPGGRFLLIALGVSTYFSLGSELVIYGHGVVPLPTLLGHDSLNVPGLGPTHVPLFNNVLANRLMLYASLAVAVISALWLASRPAGDRLGWALPAVAVLLLIPNPASGAWETTFQIPPFFTDSAYRACLAPNENVLPLPIGSGGQSMLWQTAADFRFHMAGGRIATTPPTTFMHPDSIAQISVGYLPGPNQSKLLKAYIEEKGVTSVIVDKAQSAVWAPALDRIAKRQNVGGVLFYRVSSPATTCPGAQG